MKHEDYFPSEENAWNSADGRGKVVFVFKQKLRKWNLEVYGHLNLGIKELVKELNLLDFVAASDESVDVETLVSNRILASSRVWNLVKAKESFLSQKANNTWLMNGDSNSRFFDKAIKSMNLRNSLLELIQQMCG